MQDRRPLTRSLPEIPPASPPELPPGGTAGQVLARAADGGVEWLTVAGVSFGWGDITGTLADQVDLQAALDAKADDAHTHAIADVTGLQPALDNKQDAATAATDVELAAEAATRAAADATKLNAGGWTPGAVLVVDAGGNVIGEAVALFWDATNKRLGIGTAAPTRKLHVVSTNGETGLFEDTSALGPAFTISDGTTLFGVFGSELNLLGSGAKDTFIVSSSNGKPMVVRAPAGQTLALRQGAVDVLLVDASGAVLINKNSGAPAAAPTGTVLHFVGPDATVGRVLLDSYGITGALSFRTANGSRAAPTALTAGTQIFAINAFGRGATGYSSGGRASLTASADEDWTDTAQGTRVGIWTAANGGGAQVERLTVKNNGYVGIGTTVPGYPFDLQWPGNVYARMRNTGGSGTAGFIWQNTVRQWFAGLGYTAVGSTFEIVDVDSGAAGLRIEVGGNVVIPAATSRHRNPSIQQTTLTGTQPALNLTAARSVLQCNIGATLVISGLTVGGARAKAGDEVYIDNIGTPPVRIAHNDAGATFGNQILCVSVRGQTIGTNGRVHLIYDGNYWRCALVDPGSAIIHNYASGEYTGGGSMTWNVDQVEFELRRTTWLQRGGIVTVNFNIQDTDVGGVASNNLRIEIPNSFIPSGNPPGTPVLGADAGVLLTGAFAVVSGGSPYIFIYKNWAGANWTLTSSDNTSVSASLTFPVN
jgi:hypothetical protein